MATTQREILRKHEVAERLQMSRTTIDNWVRDGKIPAIYHPLGAGHGRVVWFDWREVCKALRIKP